MITHLVDPLTPTLNRNSHNFNIMSRQCFPFNAQLRYIKLLRYERLDIRKVLRAQVLIKGTTCSILMITLTRQSICWPGFMYIRVETWRWFGACMGEEKEWEMRRHRIASVLSLLPKERRVGGGGGGGRWRPFSHGTLPLAFLEIGSLHETKHTYSCQLTLEN